MRTTKAPRRHYIQDDRDSLLIADLQKYADGWLLSSDIAQHSERTLSNRRLIVHRLIWFLENRGHEVCGVDELRAFFHNLGHGHEDAGGRWGNPRMTKPLCPRSVETFHGHLQTFFNWTVGEGGLDVSPMERIPSIIARDDEIVPFSADQQRALLKGAGRSRYPKRDHAIILFPLDTGVRASELCGIRFKGIDFEATKCIVLGKGNKRRTVPFGRGCAKALWAMLKDDPRGPDDYLFPGERGRNAGGPMTRSGLLQLFERLEAAADIKGVRCSPHTARHTFAIEYLRNGGDTFTLQTILGHTSMTMTRKYAMIVEADTLRKHRECSPVDHLLRA